MKHPAVSGSSNTRDDCNPIRFGTTQRPWRHSTPARGSREARDSRPTSATSSRPTGTSSPPGSRPRRSTRRKMAPPRATLESVALLGGSELHRDAFASRRERVATTRVRVVGFAAGAICALLAVAALAAGPASFTAPSRAARSRRSAEAPATPRLPRRVARTATGSWAAALRRPPWANRKRRRNPPPSPGVFPACTTPRAPSPAW